MYGRTRDGRRNYVHFVTAYDIHFIVNNKYYAMKIQAKSESFYIFPEIPCIRNSKPLSRRLDFFYFGYLLGLFIIPAFDILPDLKL